MTKRISYILGAFFLCHLLHVVSFGEEGNRSEPSPVGDVVPVVPKESPSNSSKAAVQKTLVETPEKPGRLIALLISVNDYYNGLKSLEFCNKDMERLESTLLVTGYEKVIRMHPESEHPNRRMISVSNIKGVLDELLQSGPESEKQSSANDLLLIAFSGHGIQKNGRRYFCPPDTLSDFKESQLTLLFEPDAMQAVKAPGVLNYVLDDYEGQCVLLIDACRNGAEEDEITSQNETSLPLNNRLYIFSSCKAGQVSYEEPTLGHGRFMHFVINGLASGAVDESGITDFRTFQDYIFRQMEIYERQAENKGRPQKPAIYHGGETSARLTIGQKNLPGKKSEASDLAALFYESAPFSSTETVRTTVNKPDMSADHLRSAAPDNRMYFRYPVDLEDQEIFSDVVQLPGLNGEWWFQEMPWYLPNVRMAIARLLARPKTFTNENGMQSTGFEFLGKNPYAYLNTNTTETKDLFWKYVSSDECEQFLNDAIIKDMVTTLRLNSTASLSRDEQYNFFTGLDQEIELACQREKRHFSPLDLYTRAVLRHQIAMLASDADKKSNDIRMAGNCYHNALEELEKAIKGPNQEIGKFFRLFYQLCLADYCRFLSEVVGDYKSYTNQFKLLTDSLKGSSKSTLFQIAIHTENAKQNTNFRNLFEASQKFREAERRIAESRIYKTAHPLEANYYEQSGWFRMDYWRIVRASEDFKSALLIREHNEWGSENPVDSMYVTYGLHGRATICHFYGDDMAAAKDFKTALEKIELIRSSLSKDGQAFYKSRLDEREASSCERFADIALYASLETKSKIDAVGLYDGGIKRTNKTETRIRLTAKKSLLLSRLKRYDEARGCLAECFSTISEGGHNLTEKNEIPFLFFNAASLVADLMESIDKKDEAAFKESRNQLRSFLDRFTLFSSSLTGVQRDTLELRLLCSDLLLDADLAMNLPADANKDTEYLAKCMAFLAEKEGTQKYLRRYYEKIILVKRIAHNGSDNIDEQQTLLRSIAMSIQQMRNASAVVSVDQGNSDTILTRPTATSKSGTLPALASNENSADSNALSALAPKIIEPTNNHLLDRLSIVLFYFPSEDVLPITETDYPDKLRRGLALIIPYGNGGVELFDIAHTRRDVIRMQYILESETLRAENSALLFDEVFQRILKESEKTTLFSSFGTDKIRQSVFVSWADENCWPEDSQNALSKSPFLKAIGELPQNVYVQ